MLLSQKQGFREDEIKRLLKGIFKDVRNKGTNCEKVENLFKSVEKSQLSLVDAIVRNGFGKPNKPWIKG